MLGAELGLRLEAMDGLLIEAGWRYRDWSLDEGPATFDGPFARLILRL
jgi:hypothetical protein